MPVEQFTVQSSSTMLLIGPGLLVAMGIAVLLLAFFAGRRSKKIRATFVVLTIVGIVTAGFGVWGLFDSSVPSTITIGPGYLNIQSSGFSGAGNLNVTSKQVVSAYVGQISSGNFSLKTKQHGTNYGAFNIGVFTLENGKIANVVSENSTDLIIQLTNGNYLILGTKDTNTLASAFNQNVHSLISLSPF